MMRKITYVLVVLTLGCSAYDPPPSVNFWLPEGGVYPVGDPLQFTFSEPIEASSLAVRIWSSGPEDITVENEFVAGLKPALATCKVGADCGEAQLTLADDGLSAKLSLTGETFNKVKIPWRIEVAAGLADRQGRKTGVSHFFDFQFAPSKEITGETIEFQDGLYLLTAVIEKPLPAVLVLYSDILALPDGRFIWLGAKGKANEGAPKNTNNPDETHIDTTDIGFTIYAEGLITKEGDERYLQSEPNDLIITINVLKIILSEMRMTAVIINDPKTGLDHLEGTISFSGVILDNGSSEPFEYEAGNTTFVATLIPAEKTPTEAPRICGDHCGGITAQCTPPDDYPPAEYKSVCNDEDPGTTP